MVHPRRFPELEARPWFAAARISVVVTGGPRADGSDADACGFPHRPRRSNRELRPIGTAPELSASISRVDP